MCVYICVIYGCVGVCICVHVGVCIGRWMCKWDNTNQLASLPVGIISTHGPKPIHRVRGKGKREDKKKKRSDSSLIFGWWSGHVYNLKQWENHQTKRCIPRGLSVGYLHFRSYSMFGAIHF